MRRGTRFAVLVVVVAAAAPSPAAASPGPGCDKPAPGQKLVRCVSETGQSMTESTLQVTSDGTVFTGLTGSGGADPLRSRDEGASWRRARGSGLGSAGMGWIARDRRSGRIFASGLKDSRCGPDPAFSDSLAYSDDQGGRWHQVKGVFCGGGDWGKTFVGPPATAASRRTLANHHYPNLVYHCMGATVQVTRTCWKSADGGATWVKTTTPASQYPTVSDPQRLLGECKNGPRFPDPHFLVGNGVVDAQGAIYIPMNACGDPLVSISRDEGHSWTIRSIPVARARGWYAHGDQTGFVVPPNAGLPTRVQQPFKNAYGESGMSALYSQQFAIDRNGTIYFTWVDPRGDLPYLSVSRDGARSWSARRLVAAPGVKLAATSAIAVDRPGRVAITYYGSRDRLRYDGFLAYSANALAARPHFQTMQVNRTRPLLPNGVSEPTEYTGVDFGPDGTPWASFARDTCRIDSGSLLVQCDGALNYDWPRFRGVVAHLADARGGCLNARGGARGRRLGPAMLGRTRARQRRAFRGKRLRSRRGLDRYCATGGGSFRIGYPTRRLSRAQRRRARRRAVLILTSSKRFSVSRIRPGARVPTLRRRVRGERRMRIGRNTWFVARRGAVRTLFRTRGGRVRAVGIAATRLTAGPRAARRFLRAWQLGAG